MENKTDAPQTMSYSADILSCEWSGILKDVDLPGEVLTFPGEPQRDPDPKKRPETEPNIQPDVEPGKEGDDDDDDDDYEPYTEPEIGDDPGEERKKQTIM